MDLRSFQCTQLLVKAFKAGKFSVEDNTRPGRPKTSVTKANIAAERLWSNRMRDRLSKI